MVEISANDNYSYVSSEENWSAVYEELDEEISLDEISDAIAKLKTKQKLWWGLHFKWVIYQM